MNYNKISFNIYSQVFGNSEIKNNDYKFLFLNCDKNFFYLSKNYCKLLDKEINKETIEISVLFEYIYLNHSFFFEIYENKINDECLNLLTFLNANISITKNINSKLEELGCKEYLIEILNTLKYTNFIHESNYDVGKIKKSLVDIFLKIISR